jgi:chlorobactene glucosyltransferase
MLAWQEVELMLVLALIASAALLGMIGITLTNLIFFPRLKRPASSPSELPVVSVLVPARNEAAVIDGTVRRLLAQDYSRFELILLDDNSDDGTAAIARSAAGPDARLRIINGKTLPSGWAGKNWACHQLGQAAQGEILLFTDADTIWAPDGLAAVVDEMQRGRADLQTVWPTQITETWAERLTVPNIALVVLGYLPVLATHYIPLAAFGAANGQVMAFRRKAYDAIRGHEGVAAEVVEDVKLARRIKSAGLRLRMADGNRLVSCRMYTDWPGVRNGFAKSLVGGYGSVAGVVLSILFHWIVFLIPPFWLLLGFGGPRVETLAVGPVALTLPMWPVWPAILTLAGMAVRGATARFSRQRVRDALLMPVTVLVMTWISLFACWWQIKYGGPVWKGRLVKAT